MDLELDASISHVTNPNIHEHGVNISTVPKESVVKLSKSLPPRKEALESLVKSKPHYLKLHSLRSSEKKSWKEVSKKRRARHRHKRDIYEIISLFAVLQGLLFAAVSQANNMKCSDSWGPIVLAIAIAFASALAIIDKVSTLRKDEEEFYRHKDRSNAIYSQISDLCDRGAEVDLGVLQINKDEWHFDPDRRSNLHRYGDLVILLLILLSILIAFSCERMVCSGCKCHDDDS